MCDEAIDIYPSTIKWLLECFMAQGKCYKAVNRCFLDFHSIPDRYKAQEMCDGVVSEDLFLLVFYLNKYIT